MIYIYIYNYVILYRVYIGQRDIHVCTQIANTAESQTDLYSTLQHDSFIVSPAESSATEMRWIKPSSQDRKTFEAVCFICSS